MQNAVHDQQSVSHCLSNGVSLSVIKSKLVYSRLIFVDNKLCPVPVTCEYVTRRAVDVRRGPN